MKFKPWLNSLSRLCILICVILIVLPLSGQQPGSPVIIWEDPVLTDSKTNQSAVNIKARIESKFELQNVEVLVNNVPVRSEKRELTIIADKASYSFTQSISLQPGKNNIVILAANAKGVTYSGKRVINLLFGAVPEIKIVNPALKDSLNIIGTVLVRVEIISRTALRDYRMIQNGKSLTILSVERPVRKDSITYIFEKKLELQNGSNIISVEAENIIGTGSSGERNILFSREPTVKWILPSSLNNFTNSEVYTVRAEIVTLFELQNALVNLNGALLPEDKGEISKVNEGKYIFEKNIHLAPGKNSIFIQTGNAKGLATSSSRFVGYLFPVVSMVYPSYRDSIMTSGSILLKAEIDSKTPLQSVRLYLNGKVVFGEPSKKPVQKDSVTYLVESQLQLQAGTNTIYLEAKNTLGKSGSEKQKIIWQVEPFVLWVTPSSDNTTIPSGTVNIKASIKSKFDLQSVRVNLNDSILTDEGGVITRVDNDNYTYERNIRINPGQNTIQLDAGNAKGIGYSKSLKVVGKPGLASEIKPVSRVVPELPVLSWKNPLTERSEVNQPSLDIRMDIGSKEKPDSITVYLNGKVLEKSAGLNRVEKENGSYVFKSNIMLNPGDNSIYLTARNIAGTVRSKELNVKYTVPVVAAVAPPETKPDSVPVMMAAVISKVTPSSPDITWITPSRPKSDIDQNSGTIRARIKSHENLQSLLVYVNGTASEELSKVLASDTQGEYLIEKVINFQPGENNIYLVASNTAGTSKSEIRYLTNPPTNPPVVSWAVPANPKAIVNSEIITIEACIKTATTLKTVQIFVNGVQQASEMMFQNPQTGDCSYRFNKEVILKEGDNSVFIIASNFAGSTNSERRLIRFEQAMTTEKRLALVIGNADYGSSNILKNPVNDANLIEGTLKNLGFVIIKRTNASKNEMMEALRDFSKQLTEYNVALFYYAGHGIQVDGQNYLIPVDAQLKEKSDCKWEAVPVNYIVEEFERVPENINIVILDACRNNPFRSWVRGGEEGFRAINPVSGTIVSFATSEGSTAADGSGSNGTFTEELVKQIVIPQAVSSVFINTRKEVMRRTNNAQRPQEWNMLTGEFYFAK